MFTIKFLLSGAGYHISVVLIGVIWGNAKTFLECVICINGHCIAFPSYVPLKILTWGSKNFCINTENSQDNSGDSNKVFHGAVISLKVGGRPFIQVEI